MKHGSLERGHEVVGREQACVRIDPSSLSSGRMAKLYFPTSLAVSMLMG